MPGDVEGFESLLHDGNRLRVLVDQHHVATRACARFAKASASREEVEQLRARMRVNAYDAVQDSEGLLG